MTGPPWDGHRSGTASSEPEVGPSRPGSLAERTEGRTGPWGSAPVWPGCTLCLRLALPGPHRCSSQGCRRRPLPPAPAVCKEARWGQGALLRVQLALPRRLLAALLLCVLSTETPPVPSVSRARMFGSGPRAAGRLALSAQWCEHVLGRILTCIWGRGTGRPPRLSLGGCGSGSVPPSQATLPGGGQQGACSGENRPVGLGGAPGVTGSSVFSLCKFKPVAGRRQSLCKRSLYVGESLIGRLQRRAFAQVPMRRGQKPRGRFQGCSLRRGGGGAGGLDQQGGQRGSRPKSQHVENLLRVIKATF